MSVLTGYGLSGSPLGIRAEVAKQEDKIRAAISKWPLAQESTALGGYRELYDRELARADGIRSQDLVHRAALRTVPNVPILFGGFRAMVYIGLCLLAIYTAALILHKRVLADGHRRLLVMVPCILPLPWLASTSGWIVAEMGRQPWALLTLRLVRRGPGAPLLSASWWLRICGPGRVATA
jgi:cytochrome bd-type quinol oxidase subunit 1